MDIVPALSQQERLDFVPDSGDGREKGRRIPNHFDDVHSHDTSVVHPGLQSAVHPVPVAFLVHHRDANRAADGLSGVVLVDSEENLGRVVVVVHSHFILVSLSPAEGVLEDVLHLVDDLSEGVVQVASSLHLLVQLDDHLHDAGRDLVHERLDSRVGGVHVGELSNS